MNIHGFDIAIVVVYLVLVVTAGVIVSRKASQNLNSYFLAGKSIPWYVLGISNASSMFDITGTMWLVTLLFVYGLKSVWIPWLWPMFNQIFLMIYLAVWLRRSNVLTGAEWIRTRFGDDRGGELSHISVVLFALISVIGFMAY
ncbi:MAG: sodium:solute symporter, partial [Planctomycetes bacterium]|nr:sodium:solute symporter [Planctomycetota bacterium]